MSAFCFVWAWYWRCEPFVTAAFSNDITPGSTFWRLQGALQPCTEGKLSFYTYYFTPEEGISRRWMVAGGPSERWEIHVKKHLRNTGPVRVTGPPELIPRASSVPAAAFRKCWAWVIYEVILTKHSQFTSMIASVGKVQDIVLRNGSAWRW